MRCVRLNGILNHWVGQSGATPIATALASCLSTPLTKLLMLRASALPRSIRWSPSHRLASPRPASKRGPLRVLAFAPMSSVSRYSVLGCAGGVSGVSIASRLAQSRPGSVVLLVAVEICTIAFRLDLLTKANIVASALFGDGAAACVLRADETGIAAVEMVGQHTWPDTLDIMGWNVDPQGLGVIFDRAIPPFVKEHIAPAMASILARADLGLADVDRFACHPGGSKVLTALERALSLEQGALDHERTVLADYGNMSAPTALFVLQRLIQSGLPSRTLLTAMGPGFTASCVALKRAS
jgi:alkylresorcinol/alkylpyrone synthase